MSEEEVIYLLQVLEVMFWGSVKFVVAPIEAARYGFNFWNAFIISTTGGITGILAFTFVGPAIGYGWKKIKSLFQRKKKADEVPKKKFTRGNKLIVRIKIKYGLIGLAIITPAIISIPVGTIVINHFYKKKLRNIILLVVSLLIWSVILNGAAQYLKAELLH